MVLGHSTLKSLRPSLSASLDSQIVIFSKKFPNGLFGFICKPKKIQSGYTPTINYYNQTKKNPMSVLLESISI